MNSYQEGAPSGVLSASKEAQREAQRIRADYSTAAASPPPSVPERISALEEQVISIINELRAAAAKLGYQPPMPSADRISGTSVSDRMNTLNVGAAVIFDLAQGINRRL